MELERAVDEEYRPQMLHALQVKVEEEAKSIQGQVPRCVHCGQAMSYHDKRRVSWLARFGKLWAEVARYRCAPCERSSSKNVFTPANQNAKPQPPLESPKMLRISATSFLGDNRRRDPASASASVRPQVAQRWGSEYHD
jgi:hypothetical protein